MVTALQRQSGVLYEDEKARCPAHRDREEFPINCGNCNTLEYARLKAHWDKGEAVIRQRKEK